MHGTQSWSHPAVSELQPAEPHWTCTGIGTKAALGLCQQMGEKFLVQKQIDIGAPEMQEQESQFSSGWPRGCYEFRLWKSGPSTSTECVGSGKASCPPHPGRHCTVTKGRQSLPLPAPYQGTYSVGDPASHPPCPLRQMSSLRLAEILAPKSPFPNFLPLQTK